MVPFSLPVRITALCVGVGFLLTCDGDSTTEVSESVPVAVVEVIPELHTLERGKGSQR